MSKIDGNPIQGRGKVEADELAEEAADLAGYVEQDAPEAPPVAGKLSAAAPVSVWGDRYEHSLSQFLVKECPMCGGRHLYSINQAVPIGEPVEEGAEYEVPCKHQRFKAVQRAQSMKQGQAGHDAAVASLDTFTVKIRA